jgi:hypothetical protein
MSIMDKDFDHYVADYFSVMPSFTSASSMYKPFTFSSTLLSESKIEDVIEKIEKEDEVQNSQTFLFDPEELVVDDN